jgi:ribosomal protein S12 methylthiotransferase accessory factor
VIATIPAPELTAGYAEQAEAFYRVASAAAEKCGVTRLADITGLDRIGLPVWQAVRPLGRALSVHQGKGSWPLFARIGALCEAIESHCAEQAPADGPLARFEDVPRRLRAVEITDYCAIRRNLPDDMPIRWAEATDLLSGGRRLLPHACVSLDYTSGLPSAFDRTSNALGAGPDLKTALRTALLEAIERDAVGALDHADIFARLAAAINPSSIPFPWFDEWLDRLNVLGIQLRLAQARAVCGVPVLVCHLAGETHYGGGWRNFSGSAAHPCPELALFRALAEAIQSRLTWIAAVRDDILPADYRITPPGPPRNDPRFGRSWNGIAPGPADLSGMADQLAQAGFRELHYKQLGSDLSGIAVVKILVPGLGSATRERRGVG